MKKILVMLAGMSLLAIVAFAAETPKVSRLTAGIAGQGESAGSVAVSNLASYVVSGSPTNEYALVLLTATVALDATSYTNSFGQNFASAPIAFIGRTSGFTSAQQTNASFQVTVISTISNLVVAGLTTNSVANINNIPVMLYGLKRVGKLSQ